MVSSALAIGDYDKRILFLHDMNSVSEPRPGIQRGGIHHPVDLTTDVTKTAAPSIPTPVPMPADGTPHKVRNLRDYLYSQLINSVQSALQLKLPMCYRLALPIPPCTRTQWLVLRHRLTLNCTDAKRTTMWSITLSHPTPFSRGTVKAKHHWRDRGPHSARSCFGGCSGDHTDPNLEHSQR